MSPIRRGAVTLTVIAAVAMAIAFWHDYPIAAFGGKYLHAESGAVYEFRDGLLFENGHEIATYTMDSRTLHIQMISKSVDVSSFAAHIGWNTVTLPLPNYGDSVLVKK